MTDAEIIDRMDIIASRVEDSVGRVEKSVAQVSERLVKVEVRLDATDKAQGSLQRRQAKTEEQQVANRIRIAYIAGATAVGTVIASRLLDMGIAAARSALGGG